MPPLDGAFPLQAAGRFGPGSVVAVMATEAGSLLPLAPCGLQPTVGGRLLWRLGYPIDLHKEHDGRYSVDFPDFDEAFTNGDTFADLRAAAGITAFPQRPSQHSKPDRRHMLSGGGIGTGRTSAACRDAAKRRAMGRLRSRVPAESSARPVRLGFQGAQAFDQGIE